MKLSTRTRYGLRAVLSLAETAGDKPVQLKTIAERQDISLKYLEYLMSMLKTAGIVRSVRGAHGGYVLARPTSKIELIEIFNALEGPIAITECLDDESYCDKTIECITRHVWKKMQDAMVNVLSSITL